MKNDPLFIYWNWLRELPHDEQQQAIIELLHQIIIELRNIEARK